MDGKPEYPINEPINDPIDKREEFMDDYLHCPLCGTEMLFTHVTNFAFLSVNEEAHCEPCQVRIKKNLHPLH